MADNVNALWDECEDFHLMHGMDLFTDGYIEFPFGRLTLEKDNLLFLHDFSGFAPEEIVAQCRKYIGTRTLDFYFTPASKGNARALKSYLRQAGYAKRDVVWHLMRRIKSGVLPAGVKMEKATAELAYRRIRCSVLGEAEYSPAKTKRAMTGQGKLNNRFMIIRAAGKPVGAAACAWLGEAGYLHSLSVLLQARQLGYGRALVDARLQIMKDNGVKRVYTAVYADNKAALALQQKRGYEPFCTCEYWKV